MYGPDGAVSAKPAVGRAGSEAAGIYPWQSVTSMRRANPENLIAGVGSQLTGGRWPMLRRSWPILPKIDGLPLVFPGFFVLEVA